MKYGKVVILYGDVPIIREETIRELVEKSVEKNEKATILTSRIKNPTGYGRIIRDKDGKILKIIEEKDLEEKQRRINYNHMINGGVTIENVNDTYIYDDVEIRTRYCYKT